MQKRLVLRMRRHVQNGDFTERGFARSLGISQVHIHNVLKGARSLSINLNDLVLKRLGLTIFDICTPDELRRHLAVSSILARPCVDLPFQEGRIGPGNPWSTVVDPRFRHPVPCFLVNSGATLLLVRLGDDPRMESSLSGSDIAVLDLTPSIPTPDALYVIDRGSDAVIRRVRSGARKLYLAADSDLDHPEDWEAMTERRQAGISRGRVRWLGRERDAGTGTTPHLAAASAIAV